MHLSVLYIIFASSIWGIDGYVRQGSPLGGDVLVALESSVAGIAMLLFLWFFRKKHIQKITNLKALIAMILLGGVGGSWCFSHALAATESLGFVFVLLGLQPLFAIITSAILLGERPHGSFYGFAATTIFASILLTLGDTGFTFDTGSIHAYIYALLTSIFWGSSTTFGKIVISHNSHLYALALRFFFTGVIGWFIVVFSGEMIGITDFIGKISLSPISILFLIFISDIFAYSIYLRGLKDIPATMATIFELTFPLTGFIIDYAINDSLPSPMKIVAAFTILLSIVILPYCHFIEEDKNNIALA